jgi:hypothetical protein
MYWSDRVSDWKPLYIDDERPVRNKETLAPNPAQVKRDDRDPGRYHKTADRWLGLLRGWADKAEYHQSLLAALNQRHREFWRRR